MIKLKIKYDNSQTDLRFPCTEKEMGAALERIHAEDVTPLELYVSEVIFPEELGCLQDRFVNLDEVNFLGKRMDSFFGDEEYQFYEAMKSEGFDTLPDLINLSFNLNRYPLIRDISDMGKIGREYLLTVKGCLPADDEDDPKYAEFGRELIQSGKGVFTEHGLLFVNENTPIQKLYDGQVFPPYVYDSDVLCIARADYNGKSEYLYLPCEEKAIDKAFARLGAAPENAKITLEDFSVNNPKWFERFKQIAADEGVYELNGLANAINSADTDLKKLWLVAEYAEVEDSGQLARLAENIGCFKVIEDVSDYEDDGVRQKLTSAVWLVEMHGDRLFGRIDCSLKEALTAEETEALRNWIIGQCSDGLCEGFEQQPIDTMDGELFVSFWNSSDDYAMMTESEFSEYLQNTETQMGGMQI